MIKKVIFVALASIQLAAFEESPWLDFPYEFHFRSSIEGSYYSSINDGQKVSCYTHSFNEQLNLNLGVVTLSQIDLQLEMEAFKTKATTGSLESLGAQCRYQLLDDIQGDPISLTFGASFRFVPDHALNDPYTPYHELLNLEGTVCIGKEFDQVFNWVKRTFLLLGAGMANTGSPWARFNSLFEMHRQHHVFGAFLQGYFGFGSTHHVNVNHFHGYAKIAHQSIDVGLLYRYLFDIWGTLSIELSYRPYAQSFPSNFSKIEIRYNLPFSLF